MLYTWGGQTLDFTFNWEDQQGYLGNMNFRGLPAVYAGTLDVDVGDVGDVEDVGDVGDDGDV